MIFDINYLIEKYRLNITGVVHVGASYAQEMSSYNRAGIKRVIWIEAIREIYDSIYKTLQPYPSAICFHACISNRDHKRVRFNITSNKGQSSSLFNLKEHAQQYPNIVVVEQRQLRTITLDTLLKKSHIEIKGEYNFLVMDIQGAELLALKGMKKNLNKFQYLYLEVNQRELYEGCALEPEVDRYLREHHFAPVESRMRPAGWGDKFYMHDTLIPARELETHGI